MAINRLRDFDRWLQAQRLRVKRHLEQIATQKPIPRGEAKPAAYREYFYDETVEDVGKPQVRRPQ